METSWIYLLSATLLLCMAATNSMSLPDVKDNQDLSDESMGELDENRRAQWLDTRDLQDEFKDMVYMAVMELINEGKIAEGVVQKTSAVSKRARWQGFCFRRTKNRRFLPYICWKGGKK